MRNPRDAAGASGSLAGDARCSSPKPGDRQRRRFHAQAKWQATHPKEIWAHAALRSALKRGLLERLPCEICGAEPADGHHDDYDIPLRVRWLCRAHHKAVHRDDSKPEGGRRHGQR
jgi:hypothetical protein